MTVPIWIEGTAAWAHMHVITAIAAIQTKRSDICVFRSPNIASASSSARRNDNQWTLRANAVKQAGHIAMAPRR